MKKLTIVFNQSKDERGKPSKNYKKMIKYLKEHHRCVLNKDQLKYKKLKNANLLIFAGS